MYLCCHLVNVFATVMYGRCLGAKEIDIAATLEHIRDQRINMVRSKVRHIFLLKLSCFHLPIAYLLTKNLITWHKSEECKISVRISKGHLRYIGFKCELKTFLFLPNYCPASLCMAHGLCYITVSVFLSVCLSVCLSVTFMYHVIVSKHILKLFHLLVAPPV